MQKMMKNFVRASLMLLVFAVNAFSQNGTITGFVSDAKTKEPLIGVTILINELKNVGASTDENGRFKISAPVGSYSIKGVLPNEP
jgi:hypothetical protein